MKPLRILAPLALAVLFGACDNETLQPPTANPNLVDPLFARYVAFGNSITAGFQSGGINDSVQLLSYANLLAGQMGTEFNTPLLNRPGCPAPYTNVFTQARVGPAVPGGCAFRNPSVPERLNNVAFPGAEVITTYDYFDPSIVPSATDVFKTFLLGGRTQVEAARDVQPTFVTIWIGNNDALGSVLSATNPGNPALVTAPATFTTRYTAMMDALDSYGTIQGGVIIGVVQVGLAPYLTQGRVWKGVELQYDAASAPLNFFDVNNNCLPFTPIPGTSDTAFTSVPFPVGATVFALANARRDSVVAGQLPPQNVIPAVLDCTDANAVTDTEMLNLFGSVAAYNTAIAAAATARDWIFIDPNDLLRQLAGVPGQIRSFPAFDPADPQNVTAPFGAALSLDGIHPSTSAHRAVANALIQAINAKYSTSIPALN